MIKKLFFIAFTTYISFANAQWQYTNGPFDGNVYSLASNGTDIFAGTNNGVYKYAPSWASLSYPCCTVTSIIISGTNIFVAELYDGGVSLSTDNGNNWTLIDTGFPYQPPIYQYWANAYSLCKGSGSSIFVGTSCGVYVTNNYTKWDSSGLGNNDVRSLAASGSNVFAGTYGDGIFLSTNNGGSWVAVNNGFTDNIVYSITIIGTEIFAGTNNGVFLSNNNGSSWTPVNTGLPNGNVNAFTISGTTVFAGTANGIFLSIDNGNSWNAVNTGLTNTTILSLAISGTTVFTGTDGGGVWKRPLSEMITVNINVIDSHNSFYIYPNPSLGKATIITADIVNSIKIYNTLGLQIIATSQNEIDISNQPPGIFFVSLEFNDEILYKKLIKQ